MWLVERSPYWESWRTEPGFFEASLEGGSSLVGWVGLEVDGEGAEGSRPPMVVMASAASSSAASSGPESASKMVFRFAGGGRLANEVGFLSTFSPYFRVGILWVVIEVGQCEAGSWGLMPTSQARSAE